MSKPRFYAVRPGYWLHGVTRDPIGPGSVVELTDEQAEARANQIEGAPKGHKDGDMVDYVVVPSEVAVEAPVVVDPVDPVSPVDPVVAQADE
jgi:hypothetical protein